MFCLGPDEMPLFICVFTACQSTYLGVTRIYIVYMNGLLHEISVFVSSARSDGSGELLHMHMLSRAFATRIITQSIDVDEGLDLNIDL